MNDSLLNAIQSSSESVKKFIDYVNNIQTEVEDKLSKWRK